MSALIELQVFKQHLDGERRRGIARANARTMPSRGHDLAEGTLLGFRAEPEGVSGGCGSREVPHPACAFGARSLKAVTDRVAYPSQSTGSRTRRDGYRVVICKGLFRSKAWEALVSS